METALMNYSSSGDYKHRIRNPTWTSGNNLSLYSYPSDNLLLSSFLSSGYGYFTGGGLYPPAVSVFRPQQTVYNNRQQPPLLPLPISMPRNCNSNNNIRINKNVKNRRRDHSLTPKKWKNQKKDSKKQEEPAVLNNDIIRPDPKDLPKDVISNIFSSTIDDSSDNKFSGSVVFTPSPPPSSLPLPSFSLRPKLSCHVEAAAGLDVGATDSLRRLLRL